MPVSSYEKQGLQLTDLHWALSKLRPWSPGKDNLLLMQVPGATGADAPDISAHGHLVALPTTLSPGSKEELSLWEPSPSN